MLNTNSKDLLNPNTNKDKNVGIKFFNSKRSLKTCKYYTKFPYKSM